MEKRIKNLIYNAKIKGYNLLDTITQFQLEDIFASIGIDFELNYVEMPITRYITGFYNIKIYKTIIKKHSGYYYHIIQFNNTIIIYNDNFNILMRFTFSDYKLKHKYYKLIKNTFKYYIEKLDKLYNKIDLLQLL